MYNERTLRPEYRQFTFCLLGVATPNELIKDRRSTAYNIGETLNLRDFDPAMDDLSPLASQLSDQDEQGRGLLSQVLYWTGGQPYLTAKLCRDMRFNQTIDGQGVDALVQTEFNSLARLETQDVHFEPMTRFLKTRLGTPAESLELYRRILTGERVLDQTAQAYIELKLSGLVKRDGEGFLIIDDLVDTGTTAKVVRALLPKAHFATVYAKPAGKPLVDTFITEVSQNTWIMFPWDTEPQFSVPLAKRDRSTEPG